MTRGPLWSGEVPTEPAGTAPPDPTADAPAPAPAASPAAAHDPASIGMPAGTAPTEVLALTRGNQTLRRVVMGLTFLGIGAAAGSLVARGYRVWGTPDEPEAKRKPRKGRKRS